MSSCCRSINIAFLGASFRFCAAAPPNHPHIAEGYEIDRYFREFEKSRPVLTIIEGR
jgi:hypothetical protein